MLHAERINCITHRIKKNQSSVSASESQLFYETQRLIEDPRVQRAIDEIVKIYDDLRDVYNVFLSTWEEQHKNSEANPDYDGDNQEDADDTSNFVHNVIILDDENEDSEKEEEKKEDKKEEEKDENKEEKRKMRSEQLVTFEHPIAIPRGDMIPLAPTVPNQLINSSIVQAWSFLMNKSRLTARPSCFFFGINHNRPLKISLASQKTSQEDKDRSPKSVLAELSQAWLDWLQLCNAKHQFMEVDLVEEMSELMNKLEHPKAEDDIMSYEFENVSFIWKSTKQTLDCGVFYINSNRDAIVDKVLKFKVSKKLDVDAEFSELKEMIYVSDFLKENKDYVETMSLQFDQVIDYVTINDYNLVNKSFNCLFESEWEKGSDPTSKDMGRMDKNSSIGLGAAKCVFFPLKKEDHYIIVVINFRNETVDELDNTEYEDTEEWESIKSKSNSKIFEEKKASKGKRKAELQCQINRTSIPESKEDNYSRSYLLLHMKAYDGVNGLGLGSIKHEFERLKHHHITTLLLILLNEENQMQTKLLANVEEWELRKNKEAEETKSKKGKNKE
uniref:Ubiquitin-like protease family profile domain-containing protein n=1 Tax=Chenopodium quinoa TaxID=63459 RepID=A0A803N5Q4_CHEQI